MTHPVILHRGKNSAINDALIVDPEKGQDQCGKVETSVDSGQTRKVHRRRAQRRIIKCVDVAGSGKLLRKS